MTYKINIGVSDLNQKIGTIGLIGRFKPLHNGGASMLESICEKADYVKIGIGSAYDKDLVIDYKYNLRNPFTPDESKNMIDAFLKERFNNYEVLLVPDFGHIPGCENGQPWRKYVVDKFGELDYFVSGNGYVADLLQVDYNIIHPVVLIPENRRVKLKATEVRVEMARGNDWKEMVPKQVAKYIMDYNLDRRFRVEFGLETISNYLGTEYWMIETGNEERLHTYES
jgi:nicotinamide-nucleotide adenylyltransferase